MSNKNKKETIEVKVEEAKPKFVRYGTLIYRDGPGWRTDCIEVDQDNKVTIVKSLEPNFKGAAFSYASEYIERMTSK